MTRPVVIAIDGPSASGKSSTAGRVAHRLGMAHIDTGSLYRALTWIALRGGLTEASQITTGAEEEGIRLAARGLDLVVVAGDDGADIEHQIRTPAVTAMVSAVSAMPEVRDWVNERLRAAASALPGAVLDGRDIGTVVFPDARLKVFLTASPEARALRRLRQRGVEPSPSQLDEEAAILAERDRLDAARPVAPLRRADDAVEVDTTHIGFDEQVDRIVKMARDRGLPGA